MSKGKPTIESLLERIEYLEGIVREKPRTTFSSTLDQIMERGKMQGDKRAREVLAKTFGIIPKERGRAMLRAVEEGRALWV